MIEEYDIVELLVDIGKIKSGSQGVVVHFSKSIPDLFAVEFCSENGATLAILDIRVKYLRLVEKYQPPIDP